MRHVNFEIPSRQARVRVMGVRVLTPEQLSEMAPCDMEKIPLSGSTSWKKLTASRRAYGWVPLEAVLSAKSLLAY